jgi:hypothetical protein
MTITEQHMSLNKALDFLFFVAEVNDADAMDLEAASILAESKLRKGSRIDVWADGKFYAARITASMLTALPSDTVAGPATKAAS